jgi:hypothetical protein
MKAQNVEVPTKNAFSVHTSNLRVLCGQRLKFFLHSNNLVRACPVAMLNAFQNSPGQAVLQELVARVSVDLK